MRVEEHRVVGADDDVRLVDEVLPAARAHPVHGGDHRLPDTVHQLRGEHGAGVEGVPHVRLLEPAGVAGDVYPGAEGAVAVRLEHGDVDGLVVADRLPGAGHLTRRLTGERVQGVGTVEGDRRNCAVDLEDDRFGIHGYEGYTLSSCAIRGISGSVSGGSPRTDPISPASWPARPGRRRRSASSPAARTSSCMPCGLAGSAPATSSPTRCRTTSTSCGGSSPSRRRACTPSP